MAVLLGKLPLLASDYSGALSVLSGMDGYVLLCGPAGCLENYTGMDDPEWFSHPDALFTSDMHERDVVFGIERSLKERVRSHVEKIMPSFVALVGSPVTSLIGSDLGGIARELEDELGVPVIAVETTGNDDYTAGVEAAYRALAERFVVPGAGMGLSGVNVIGYTSLDYCDEADLEALMSWEQERGEEVRCVVGRCTVEQIANLGNAMSNLVVSASGLSLARFLRGRFGTPYSCELPIAGFDLPFFSVPHSASPKRVLIIGDQVISNSLRTFAKARYAATCDVATAHALDTELAREGDVHITSEPQLAELVSSGYDLIIADPLCRAIVSENVGFVDLPHFALSSLPFAAQHLSLFKDEVVETLDAAFSR